MKNINRRSNLSIFASLILLIFTLSACHTVQGTVQGVGKDVQSVTGSGKNTHKTR